MKNKKKKSKTCYIRSGSPSCAFVYSLRLESSKRTLFPGMKLGTNSKNRWQPREILRDERCQPQVLVTQERSRLTSPDRVDSHYESHNDKSEFTIAEAPSRASFLQELVPELGIPQLSRYACRSRRGKRTGRHISLIYVLAVIQQWCTSGSLSWWERRQN